MGALCNPPPVPLQLGHCAIKRAGFTDLKGEQARGQGIWFCVPCNEEGTLLEWVGQDAVPAATSQVRKQKYPWQQRLEARLPWIATSSNSYVSKQPHVWHIVQNFMCSTEHSGTLAAIVILPEIFSLMQKWERATKTTPKVLLLSLPFYNLRGGFHLPNLLLLNEMR